MARALKTLATAGLAFFAVSLPALSGGWTITGNVGEKVDFNDNTTLAIKSPGWVASPIETLHTDFGYGMHDGQFDLTGDLLVRNFFGPGKPVTNDQYQPSLKARWQKFGPRTALDFSVAYALEQTPFVDNLLLSTCVPVPGTNLFDCGGDLVDPIQFLGIGQKHSLSAAFGWTQKLDARDTLIWNSTASDKIFTSGSGTNFQTAGSSVQWTRLLTKRAQGSWKAAVDWIGIDDATNLDRFSYSLTSTFKDQLSSRLSIHTTGTTRLSSTYRNAIGLPGAPRVTDQLWGASFSAGVQYLASPVTTINLDALIATDEQLDQDFFNRYSATLSVSHQLNDLSSIDVASQIGISDAGALGGGKQSVFTFSLAPTYSVQLAKTWNMAANYRFALRNTQAGTAVSNEVGLSLTHNFAYRP